MRWNALSAVPPATALPRDCGGCCANLVVAQGDSGAAVAGKGHGAAEAHALAALGGDEAGAQAEAALATGTRSSTRTAGTSERRRPPDGMQPLRISD